MVPLRVMRQLFHTNGVTALLVGFVLNSSVLATVSIAPGESASLVPDECAEASGYKGPLGNSWDACISGCKASCDLGAPSADAVLFLSYVVGSQFVTSTIYSQFKISDPYGTRNEVDGTIEYNISWMGLWRLTGAFTGYNEARAEISVYLYDVTSGSRLVKKTEPPVHRMTVDGFVGIDIIDLGVGLDSGGTSNSMTAKLVRGHTYRTALTLHITAKGLANADIALDYELAELGVQWNEFVATISPDLNERLAQLEKRVDSLEAEMSRLRFGLEHHTHTYLTGRGEGHNNTEAQTSEALIMEEDNIPDSSLQWLPNEHTKGEQLRRKSVLLSNYPNPFNPTTTILYALPEATAVRIVVYNNLGQMVITLVDAVQPAGEHSIELDATNLSTGVYYYRLTTPQYAETRKLLLLK